MIDTDVRLGLSGSDLAIRDRTFQADVARLDDYNLDVNNSTEFRVLADGGYASEIVGAKRFREEDFIVVRKERIVDILTVLRDDPATRYDLVSDIFGLDLLGFEREPRFEVIYSLYSLTHKKRIVIKAQVDEDDPTIDTASEVWMAVEWAEREIFDMFGIEFNGHNDLRRILMPDDWVGHPLRKDFPLGGEEVEFSHNVRDRSEPSTA
ncbi:MAG: NADH-quinone oxidoreductase subunit C [Akkermansiaceae bacterium]|nr:NADH-quinone oxidoreductase subunit C [Armatimonadota bacterium]